MSLTARDYLHERGGLPLTLLGIVLGAAASWLVASGLAVASGVTFAVAELADLAVYAPLRARHTGLAVMISNIVGATVDSVLFLGLAFGLTAVAKYGLSQATVKLLMSLAVAGPLLHRRHSSAALRKAVEA